MHTQRIMFAAGLLLLSVGLAFPQATPPEYINYQGVLRDTNDNPLDGSYDMVFQFYDAETVGNLLLTDSHTGVDAVTVSGGLFNALLGDGTLTPGTYSSLSEVFAKESDVYLEVQVGAETLTPRIRMASAGYALNAAHLDGRPAGEFLDTSSIGQIKAGDLALNDLTVSGNDILFGGGSKIVSGAGNLQFRNDGDTDDLFLLAGNSWDDGRIILFGGGRVEFRAGNGKFDFFSGSGIAPVAELTALGDFSLDGQLSALGGGYFKDPLNSGEAYVGYGDRGIEASGTETGGYFANSSVSAYAYLAYDHPNGWPTGIEAFGYEVGGYFHSERDGSYAYAAAGDSGIAASGPYAGVLVPVDSQCQWGIEARGSEAGGYFEDSDDGAYAYVGYGRWGIKAEAQEGGHFSSASSPAYAWLATNDPGRQVSYGIEAGGNSGGAWFSDTNTGTTARVARETYKITGTGTVDFVQNHPYEKNRVIVYAAPEGDEAATYTRGTARLVDGMARVALNETFAWVTNPDIGLTAYVTPRDEPVALAVVSLTTSELVVRGPVESPHEIVLDYIVYGLRIGFEGVSVVQEKTEEAYIPLMKSHRDLYERRPELREYSALERFKEMHLSSSLAPGAEPLDFSRSQALRDAIQEYDPDVHGPVGPERRRLEPSTHDVEDERGERDDVARPRGETKGGPPRPAVIDVGTRARTLPADYEGNVYARSFRPSARDLASLMAVAERVEAGDVLVIDPGRPGLMSLAREAADARVFGVVAGEPGVVLGAEPPEASQTGAGLQEREEDGPDPAGDDAISGAPPIVEVPVALSGVALCKVDAGYGSVRPGDLLTTSPTPGHAMVTHDPQPGTILGKALEPMQTGTGLIRVLVMLR